MSELYHDSGALTEKDLMPAETVARVDFNAKIDKEIARIESLDAITSREQTYKRACIETLKRVKTLM